MLVACWFQIIYAVQCNESKKEQNNYSDGAAVDKYISVWFNLGEFIYLTGIKQNSTLSVKLIGEDVTVDISESSNFYKPGMVYSGKVICNFIFLVFYKKN